MVTNTTLTTELAVSAEASLVETGEKHDTLGRRRTPAERRAELLAAYRESGQTLANECERSSPDADTGAHWSGADVIVEGQSALPAGRHVASAQLVQQLSCVAI